MLIDYIASALVSLHEFWVKDMVFSVDLLKQFLEDMEAYSNVSWVGEKEREGGRDGVYMYIHVHVHVYCTHVHVHVVICV